MVETAGELDVPSPISWADEARDLGAWMGNAMQLNAAEELYKIEPGVKAHAASGADAKLLTDWRKLTTSDHFYYMSTKDKADGGVHGYFRPYESPYDAYINYMNILDHLRAGPVDAEPHEVIRQDRRGPGPLTSLAPPLTFAWSPASR